MTWTYFKDSEVEGLNEDFVRQLEKARQIAGVPFVITSGFRTPEKNQSLVGAVQDSAHLEGLAVDLSVTDSSERFLIVKAAIIAGFTRIGIYSAHIHIDASKTLPQNMMWYSSGT